MKQLKVACLVIVITGSIISNSAWARGGGFGGGYGGGGWHYGGGWGGHYGGGHYGGGYGYGGHYRHSNYGFYFGAPFYSYPYYGFPYQYPYYYYPPTVVTVPVTPPVYIQQSRPAAQKYPPGYWYYCANPEGYYPYIKECLNDWQQVEPKPPASSSPR